MPPFRTRLARFTDPSQFNLRPSGPGQVLDIGCGNRKYPGAIGMDISGDTEADIIHDLDVYPWPLEDDSVDQVLMQDVIEHIAEPYRLMAELHRICRSDARVQLRTPHYSSVLAYSDPTHRHAFSALGIRSLAEPGFSHYSAARFDVISVTIDTWLPYRLLGIGKVANRWTDVYERYAAFTFTSMNVRAEFRVLK